MTSNEWTSRSEEWRDGWRAYQQGDTIEMSHKEYMRKSNEWKEGARYAAQNPTGICAFPQ